MISIAHLVAYNPQGKITLVISGPPETVGDTLALNTRDPSIEVEFPPEPDKYYVDDGVLTPRPEGAASLVSNTLYGVPDGASVRIQGVTYTADGSPIELEFSAKGKYEISVDAWPAVTQEFTYENPA